MGKIGISQNGWPVYDDTSNFVRFEVEGVKFWAANNDVAVVMGDFIQRFHNTIEPIDQPVKESPGYDDWSYAVRPVRGQTDGYSNHGSATADDLNATRHPRGVRNTYTPAKRKVLRELVDRYDGVLRHGEFYTSTIDGMHVEIDADRAEVKRVADRIRADRIAAEEKQQMEWKDQIELTKADAAAYGDPSLEGKKKSISELIRFGPAVARLRREFKDALASLASNSKAQHKTLTDDVGELAAKVALNQTTTELALGAANEKLTEILALLHTEAK